MNERIQELAERAGIHPVNFEPDADLAVPLTAFAELIVEEMCAMMGQAEDDAYHCFEPSERPTEYIEWLRDWQERFTKHFGVE